VNEILHFVEGLSTLERAGGLVGLAAVGILLFGGDESPYNPLFQTYLLYIQFRRLSDDEQEEIAYFAMDYCHKYLGKTTKKPLLAFENHHPDAAAQYRLHRQEIVLFRQANRTCNSLVDSLIHEYNHHVMAQATDKASYHAVLKDYSYDDHPWEFQANALAKRYKRDCIRYVLFRQRNISKF
jgi:hypothetical protein